MTGETLLEATHLSVSFGPVKALSDVDLDVRRGQIVGLIGPNGAGKTTLIDALTGFVPSKGTIRLDGTDLTRMSAHRRARAGLARTWQGADLFDDLTVRENLEVAARSSSAQSGPILERLGLADVADADPASLTEGQRKLVGVARALAARPHVLLLDEPAAGLDPSESAELGRRITDMAGPDTAVVLIDHDMSLVLAVCDHLVVLNFGAVIAAGSPEEVRRDPAVMAAYLGTGAAASAEPAERLEGASHV